MHNMTRRVCGCRGHDNQLLSEPFLADVLTVAAPNANEYLKRAGKGAGDTGYLTVAFLSHELCHLVSMHAALAMELAH